MITFRVFDRHRRCRSFTCLGLCLCVCVILCDGRWEVGKWLERVCGCYVMCVHMFVGLLVSVCLCLFLTGKKEKQNMMFYFIHKCIL